MIHLQVICPDPNDATSFYRGVGPMSRLRKQYPKEVHVRYLEQMQWSTILEADLVFMQRPFHNNHWNCAKMIKDANIPLWIDYDDNVHAILPDNPVYYIYSSQDTRQNVQRLCNIADVVTCSTPALAKHLAQFSQNVRVIPNALDDITCQRLRPLPVPETNIILWRGTNTHERDLKTIESELVELSYDPKLANWKFAFVGYNPWWITEKMKPEHVMVSGGAPIIDYMQGIYELQPRIIMIPLAKNLFNESKSNIAWIEGTYAGAVTVAQDLEEFKRPGILTYDTPKQFAKNILHLVESFNENPEALQAKRNESWEHIQKNLLLGQTTKVRRELIDELLRT